MNLCNQDCDQGRTCDCAIYYESWSSQIKTYLILMLLSGLIGFCFGVASCS